MKEFIKRIPILFPLAKLARYWIRRVLWSRRLKMKVGRAKELKIVIGASGTHQEDWIATDIEALNLLKREDWERYFKPGTVSAMLAEHVWEHMTPDEGIVAAKFCFEYLKPGGHLRVAVPDGLLPNSHYIEMVKAGGSGPGPTITRSCLPIDRYRSCSNRPDFGSNCLNTIPRARNSCAATGIRQMD